MESVLKKSFGLETFRPKQKEIIESVLKKHNTLGVLPTGSGKSLCYQVPALILEGTTIVISPLISLMQDQVNTLQEKGINAQYINSNMSKKDQEDVDRLVFNGEVDLLYVAPERFNSSEFLALIDSIHIPLVAFDEAHCISKWGHDFRPSYQEVIPVINAHINDAIKVALTATATEDVEKNIVDLLNIENDHVYKTSVKRDNLELIVNNTYQRERFILDYLNNHKDDSGIIYAATRKETEKISGFLKDNGIDSLIYHAGLSKKEREENQYRFINNDVKVIVATNAFGMGIDKENIRFIIHFNLPGDLESYYQEIGRAGRDGKMSQCILLSNSRDILLQQFFIDRSPASDDVKESMREKLDRMIQYKETSKCLSASIVKYFDKNEYVEPCGMCSNCLNVNRTVDMTKEAKFLIELSKDYEISPEKAIQILRGESADNIIHASLHHAKQYGSLSNYLTSEVHHIIEEVVYQGYLHLKNNTLYLVDKSYRVLDDLDKVYTVTYRTQFKEKVDVSTETSFNESLYQQLKDKREELAVEKNIEESQIFTDTLLKEIAKKMPENKSDMIKISGIGNYKLKHYSPHFLKVIEEYKK
ncbi:DNA helicase RecQ [Nosocomiicoccus ampullae]|nr:DNA helicase RecQ [Nosocomiicoccus ampullae]QYA47619.1 DNA helicase RecQ [Nosocomiicoccus ampullae]